MNYSRATVYGRWRAARRHNDDGVGLSEYLVAMMIFAIMLVFVSGFFISGMNATTLVGTTNTNTKNAANGMNEAARVIRAGTANPVLVGGRETSNPAIVEANPESLVLYAYVNLDGSGERPVMIRLYVNAQRQLVEARWPSTALAGGYWSFPSPSTTPASTRILASAIATATAGGPSLFTYYSNVQGTSTPVAAAGDLSTIVSVRVTMTVQLSPTDNRSPVTLQNLVGIPNLGAVGAIS